MSFVWNHTCAKRARSASSIRNHKYNFRLKLHCAQFNDHSFTLILYFTLDSVFFFNLQWGHSCREDSEFFLFNQMRNVTPSGAIFSYTYTYQVEGHKMNLNCSCDDDRLRLSNTKRGAWFSFHIINNGNWTEWSAILSEITRVPNDKTAQVGFQAKIALRSVQLTTLLPPFGNHTI